MNLEFQLIRLIYAAACVCGLAPFKFDAKLQKASASLPPLIYTAFMIIFVSIILFVCKSVEYENIQFRDAGHTTTIMVNVAQICSSYWRTVGIYILQLSYHSAFVRCINDGFRIHKHLDELCHDGDENAPSTTFLDTKCRSFMYAKGGTVLLQIGIIFLTSFLYPYIAGLYGTQNVIVYVASTLFTDGIGIVVSSIYCGGLLVALQFYRNLNRKLQRVIKAIRRVSWDETEQSKVKMQFYLDASDTLDRIAAMYDSITKYTLNFNGLLSMAILLTLLNSFMFSLCGVKRDSFFFLILYLCAYIILQAYFIYYDVSRMIQNVQDVKNAHSEWMEVVYDICLCVFYMIEMNVIIWVSNEVIIEVYSPAAGLTFVTKIYIFF